MSRAQVTLMCRNYLKAFYALIYSIDIYYQTLELQTCCQHVCALPGKAMGSGYIHFFIKRTYQIYSAEALIQCLLKIDNIISNLQTQRTKTNQLSCPNNPRNMTMMRCHIWDVSNVTKITNHLTKKGDSADGSELSA